MIMKTFYSLSEVARQLDVAPRVLSDAFYQRVLADKRCPIVCGRRTIPIDYVPEIKATLRELGKLKKVKA